MIKIKIKYLDNHFSSILVTGHANSAEYGKDLICAAVSATITGACNALKEPQKFHIELNEGKASIEALEMLSNHDEVVLETMIVGLKTIAEGNEKFIKIEQ